MIKVVFFASLKEQLGCADLAIEPENINTVDDVKSAILLLHPQWANIFNQHAFLMAVNHVMVMGDHAVKNNDEVAFFPPVTGG